LGLVPPPSTDTDWGRRGGGRDLRRDALAAQLHGRFGLWDQSDQAAAKGRAGRHPHDLQCLAQAVIAGEPLVQFVVVESAPPEAHDRQQQEGAGRKLGRLTASAWRRRREVVVFFSALA